MKKMVVFLMMLLFCIAAFPEQNNQPKKYDMQFSLSGGSIKGQFSLAGEFAYARKFSGVFTQFSTMANSVNGKGEYGFSAGIGAQGDTFQVYLFLDSLYHNKLWTQVRPMFRLNFGWLNLGGSYSLPIGSSKIQVGDDLYVTAAKVWQADFNLIPVSFIRLYGDFKSMESQYQKLQAGIEIRPIKFVSVKADWNKVDNHVYSNWSGFEDIRVTLNFLFGTEQQDFRQIPARKVGPFIVRPAYPVLVAKTKAEDPDDTTPHPKTVEVKYVRVEPFYPESPDRAGLDWVYGSFEGGNTEMSRAAENTFIASNVGIKTETVITMQVSDPRKAGFVRKRLFINGKELVFNGSEYGEVCFILHNDESIEVTSPKG